MIFTETREGRRFVGEFPPGTPVVATLAGVCSEYRIASGWLHGAGMVRDAILAPLTEEGTYGDHTVVPGVSLVTSLQGTIAMRDGEQDVLVRAMLVGVDGQTHAGQLVEAVSNSLEVFGTTFDDITLRRVQDHDLGIGRLMDVTVNEPDVPVREKVQSGRVAMEAMPSRLLEPKPMPTMKVGDYLEHPRLGVCEVVQVIDDDRVSISMPSGKVAQLHLGLLTLSGEGKRNGRKIYTVQIRRRNQ